MKNKNVLLTIGVLLILVTVLCGCGAINTPQPENDPRTDMVYANPYTFDHVTMDLPEGFTVYESDGLSYAISPDYPTVSDNITFAQTAADNPGYYTQAVLDETMTENISGYNGSTHFEKTSIDGVTVIIYSFNVFTSGIEMSETQYYFFGKTYSDIITFTCVSDTYDDAFAHTMASFKVQ